jgi:hypothetical protein
MTGEPPESFQSIRKKTGFSFAAAGIFVPLTSLAFFVPKANKRLAHTRQCQR